MSVLLYSFRLPGQVLVKTRISGGDQAFVESSLIGTALVAAYQLRRR
jgi:hypothetical protein